MRTKLQLSDPQMQLNTKQINPLSLTIFLVCQALSVVGALLIDNADLPEWLIPATLVVFTLVGVYVLFALKIANEWEKAVVLRYGKFRGLRGPGLFWIVPIARAVDTMNLGGLSGMVSLAKGMSDAKAN